MAGRHGGAQRLWRGSAGAGHESAGRRPAAHQHGGLISGSTARYYPFGAWRTTPTQTLTDRGYTGHLENMELGLIYMNARYYVPYINRFLSPDTIVPDREDPQSFNRYAYARNNPLKYIDADGHCWGPASFIRGWNIDTSWGTVGGGTNCANIDTALQLVLDPDVPVEDRILPATVVGGFGVASVYGAVGTTGLVCSAAAPCAKVVESALGIGAYACRDGDCTNEAGSAINTVQHSLPTVERFWNRVTNFRGNKVYQRNDLIEPMRADAQGVTNLERMLRGNAPIGPDGWQLQLHHMLQTQEGPVAEVTRTFHQMYARIIHINPPTVPSSIDRAAFRIWREAYWIERARDFIR